MVEERLPFEDAPMHRSMLGDAEALERNGLKEGRPAVNDNLFASQE
jgi:hypothetical protein